MDLLNEKPRSGFVAPYKWDSSRVCMIKHKHGGFLRANPKNHEECNFKGGQTDWSKWRVHLLDDAKIVQIQNIKTKKYLEIDKHGEFIAVSNNGGLSSKFLRHSDHDKNRTKELKESDDILLNGSGPSSASNSDDAKDEDADTEMEAAAAATHGDGKRKSLRVNISDEGVKLESVRCRGLFVAVHPNDGAYINTDANHDHNLLYFLVRGKSDEGLFKEPYLLKQQNTVIIHHAFGGSVRVNPKNESVVDSEGDKDILSRWEALPNEDASILQFRNVKSGAFLRIADDAVSCCDAKSDANTKFRVHVVESPNIVKLESVSFEGQFISVRQKGLCIGNGGPHCQMTLYRKD